MPVWQKLTKVTSLKMKGKKSLNSKILKLYKFEKSKILNF